MIRTLGGGRLFLVGISVLALGAARGPLAAQEEGPGEAAPRQEPEGPDPQPYKLPTVVVTGDLLPATSPFSDASSASLVTGGEARERGIASPRDLGTVTPNLAVFDANGERVPRFSIRGLRENNFSVGEPGVTLYIDDVPYNDLSSRGVPLYDIDQIDFLRGPQGTLFGTSRPGGVLNVLTRLPGKAWSARARAGYGSYDSRSAEAAVGGPIQKDLAFLGLSGICRARDGFMDNDFLGTHPDTRETFAGRASLRFTPAKALDVTLTLSGERFNDGAVAIVPIDQRDLFDFDRDYDGRVDQKGATAALRMAWSGDAFKVVSVTAHRRWRQDLVQDFDFSTADFVRGFTAPVLRQWTQEIRLQSPDEAEGLRWVAGGFVAVKEFEADSGTRYAGIPIAIPPFWVPGPFLSRTTATLEDLNAALFGQVTWTAAEGLDLTAGLRLERDAREMDRQRLDEVEQYFGAPPIPDQDLDDTFTSFQPRLAAAWQATPNVAAFAGVTGGYQSGGFHVSSDNPALSDYDRCASLHYEAGARTDWLDRTLLVNASLFLADYRDYHVYRPVTATQYALVNAESARTMGAELEAIVRPFEGLELTGNFGAVRAEFGDFDDPANGVDFDGKDISFVPQYTWNLGARGRLPMGFTARLEAQGVGRFYFDEANTVYQGPYALLHARAGWENDHYGVFLFGRNLTDEEYFNNAINFRDPTAGDFFVGTPGDPLMFGVEAFARF